MEVNDRYIDPLPMTVRSIKNPEDIIRITYLFRKQQIRSNGFWTKTGSTGSVYINIYDDIRKELNVGTMFFNCNSSSDWDFLCEYLAKSSLTKNITSIGLHNTHRMVIEVSESKDHTTNITPDVIGSIGWLFTPNVQTINEFNELVKNT